MLHLHRAKTRWTDQKRAYTVLIDGEEQGRIRHGEDLRLNLLPGRHRVKLRIDWGRSKPLDLEIEPGGQVFLECRSRPTWQVAFWATLGYRRHIDLNVVDTDERASISLPASRGSRDSCGVEIRFSMPDK